MNETRLPSAVATFDDKDYFLAMSSSGVTTHDTLFDFQSEIFEWTKHDQIDANALAQVKESDGKIKTYFGNYKAFVYWMNNTDNTNDVDGASGVIEDVVTVSTNTITDAQVIVDTDIAAGIYTGATMKITSGKGAGQEVVILSGLTTGVILATSFTTTPDTTSVYSIGAIDASYTAKHYEMGSATQEKDFLGMLFWGEEASNNEVTVSFSRDFGSTIGSETKSLAPSGSSIWDTALWDSGTWGTTGDRIYTVKFKGNGIFIQPKFANDDIDETFHLYGFNLLAIGKDTKQ